MGKHLYATYHDSRKQFAGHLRRHGRRMGLNTAEPAAVRAWQRRARRRLIEMLGIRRLEPAPPAARKLESADCGDHTRELWTLRTQRDVTMPFYLLRPKGGAGRRPAVICPHGHGGGGKPAVAGLALTDEIADRIAHYNYAYGVQFVRAGFLAFCPDARGFGQRQEREVRDNVLAQSCHLLQMMGAPLGVPVAGMWVFDLMRLIDHVGRRRDVAPGRIGCAGLSGGGLQALYLSAVDPRVRCAIVSGYFYGVGEALLNQPQHCDCNIVPGLWAEFDMGDIGALVAPRPLLIETGDADALNGASGLRNVSPQVAIARRAYRGHGVADRLAHHVFPGPHRWDGRQAVPWMTRWLSDPEATA